MPIKTRSSGPRNASIMIIGEAPGAEEEVKGVPFVGSSGQEFNKMLQESGFLVSECFLTNVCKYRPPENKIEHFFLDKKQTQPNELIKEGIAELLQDIAEIQPKLIIAAGNVPLWVLRGHRAIGKWRGSMLKYKDAMLMPVLHPAFIMRDWSQRAIAVHDLRRAKKAFDHGQWPVEPYNFHVRPSFSEVMDILGTLTKRADEDTLRISSDLETRRTYIACHGIAWSRTEALCIPTMTVRNPLGYFTLEEELAIWERERRLLTHPNIEVIGQNYLYDAQYFARRKGYVPRLLHDTRFKQHVAWSGMQQSLDFMSSLYCDYHYYWKDEGKEWNPKIHPEEQYWTYNCTDAVKTFEIDITLDSLLDQLHLWPQYNIQMKVWRAALQMMFRGLKIDQTLRGKMAGELMSASMVREQEIEFILGHPLNINSPKQVHGLFYGQLNCKVVKSKTTHKPSCDDNALRTFAQREPLLTPLTQRIADLRSIGVIFSNAIKAPLDPDGRIRSMFDPTAETYRWKSYENAFGTGTNLQNWTKGNEDDDDEVRQKRVSEHRADLPNVRKTIVPDVGMEIASIDLSGADAQTVAWEANDEDLKKAFRTKVKIHAHNAKSMFPGKVVTGFEQPYYDLCRTGVHLINYLGQAPTLAAAMKFSVYEADRFMKEWFRLHPGILEWHTRIEEQLQKTRCVTNKFGYRRFYFDRIDSILNEAVAWIGQSTTACVCNRALVAVEDEVELVNDLKIEFLLQVHDELVFQYPIGNREQVLRAVNPLVHVPVPYDDPLIIPWGLKTSLVSWGDCEKRDWPA